MFYYSHIIPDKPVVQKRERAFNGSVAALTQASKHGILLIVREVVMLLSPKVQIAYYPEYELLGRLDDHIARRNEGKPVRLKISRNEIINKAVEKYLEEEERGEVQQERDGGKAAE